jgi:hypothetical protein
MKDEIETLETAKLLKEKNFDVLVQGSYTQYLTTQIDPEYPEGGGPFGWTKGEVEMSSSYFRNNDKGGDFSNKKYTMYAAPTQSLVQKWLREDYGIQVYAVSGTISGGTKLRFKDYVGHVDDISKHGVGNVVQTAINDPRDEEYQTYEAALEAALLEALRRI